jgi:hypothetical protein
MVSNQSPLAPEIPGFTKLLPSVFNLNQPSSGFSQETAMKLLFEREIAGTMMQITGIPEPQANPMNPVFNLPPQNIKAIILSLHSSRTSPYP